MKHLDYFKSYIINESDLKDIPLTGPQCLCGFMEWCDTCRSKEVKEYRDRNNIVD